MKEPRNRRPLRPRSLAQRKLRPGLPPTVALRQPPTPPSRVVTAPASASPASTVPALPPAPTDPVLAPEPPVVSAPEPKPSRQRSSNALSLRGEYWEVTYDGHSAIVEDCRGLRYIALLIQNAAADRGPVHARELVALATGRTEAPVELEAKDELLDAAARRQLVKRLEELAEERERACAAQDFDKALGVDEEYERIASQLKLGAKSARSGRGTFADTGEKARKAVGKAITEAIARVAACKEVAPLAQHLNGAVRKGQWLSYTAREDWRIDFRVPLPRK